MQLLLENQIKKEYNSKYAGIVKNHSRATLLLRPSKNNFRDYIAEILLPPPLFIRLNGYNFSEIKLISSSLFITTFKA